MSVKQPKQLSVCFLPLSSACSSRQAVSWHPPPAHQHTAVCGSFDPSKIRCRSGKDANWIREQGPKGQAGRPMIAQGGMHHSHNSQTGADTCRPAALLARLHADITSLSDQEQSLMRRPLLGILHVNGRSGAKHWPTAVLSSLCTDAIHWSTQGQILTCCCACARAALVASWRAAANTKGSPACKGCTCTSKHHRLLKPDA